MKKFLLRRLALILVLSYSLASFAADTPAADDGKWYYVKSQRYLSGGPWWTQNAGFVIPGELTKADNQMFTLISLADGKVGIKSHSELMLTGKAHSAEGGNWDATGAATGWTLTSNVVAGVQGWAFPGERNGIHQGSGSWNWKVAADGWFDLGDFCTYFFYEVRPDVNLNVAIDAAQERLTATTIGTTVGKTPQAAVDAYQDAINAAKTTLESTDETAIQQAINTLAAATTTFVDAKIPLVTSSTASAPVWYLIKNTNRGGKGATVHVNGFNAQLKGTTVANSVSADGTSTGTAAAKLDHLFRFERQVDGTYVIVNAALPNGEILQGAAGGSSSAVINYGASVPTKWNLNYLGNNATLGVDEITFVSTGNSTMWHLDGNYNLVSWNGGTNTASAWYVEEFTGDVSALFQTQYDALHAQYILIADESGAAVAPYVIGVNPGQYSAAQFQALKDAYAAMVAEKDANGVTSPNIIAKFATLTSAIANFKASKVAPVPYAGTINEGIVYTLQLVQPGSAVDGYYLTNPRTDANNGSDAHRPYATFVADIDEATSGWKFVTSTTAGKHLIISNRLANEYIDEEGRVRDASGYGDNNWVYKTLMQNTLTYEDGTTLLIVKIDNNGNYLYTAGTTLGRNAASWATFRLAPYTLTSAGNNAVSNVDVKVLNRKLIVTGTTEQVKAFSVTGAQVDAQRTLNPGIYIVKVGTETFKVSVR